MAEIQQIVPVGAKSLGFKTMLLVYLLTGAVAKLVWINLVAS